MYKDYKSGKIYKIVSEIGNCIYYGSTIKPLNIRLSNHKSYFNRGIYRNSGDVLKYQDYKIVLVEEYPCNNKQELCKREGWYISNNKCVNKYIAGRTKKQYALDNKQYYKQYKKQYRIDNKQYFNQYMKQYNIDNNQRIKQTRKQYRIDNKQYLQQHLMCGCGVSYTKQNKIRHNKSKQHIRYTINPFSSMLI